MKLENRLYKSAEAAKILGVTTRTIQNYIAGNQIKAINRAGKYYFEGEELERFIKEGTDRGYYQKIYPRKKEG